MWQQIVECLCFPRTWEVAFVQTDVLTCQIIRILYSKFPYFKGVTSSKAAIFSMLNFHAVYSIYDDDDDDDDDKCIYIWYMYQIAILQIQATKNFKTPGYSFLPKSLRTPPPPKKKTTTRSFPVFPWKKTEVFATHQPCHQVLCISLMCWISTELAQRIPSPCLGLPKLCWDSMHQTRLGSLMCFCCGVGVF